MEIKQVKQLLKNLNQSKVQVPILEIGITGIGKSYLVKQVTEEEGIGFVDLRLATQEVTDLIGIPRTIKNEKTEEYETYWTKPGWWPEEGTKGILALEEVNRAPEDVRQAIFQLLTEWQLHTHKLPKGWSIVALINPDNGQYHVNQLDSAFKRRFVQIVVNPPDEIDWSVWAKKSSVAEEVIRFVSQFPKLLKKDEDVKIEARPTPAGWEMLSKLMTHEVIPPACLQEVASGIVGIEAGTTFVKSLRSKFSKPIYAKDILEDYSKVQKDYKKQVANKQTDLLYVTMIDIIATCDINKITQKQAENLKNYLLDSLPENTTNIILRASDHTLTQLSKFKDIVGRMTEVKKSVLNMEE